MSKQQIDRILNTDFSLIDDTIDAKINSIDEITGKLSQKTNFLTQFQLLLQTQIGNYKTSSKSIDKISNNNHYQDIKINKTQKYQKIQESSYLSFQKLKMQYNSQQLNLQKITNIKQQFSNKVISNINESDSQTQIQASSQIKENKESKYNKQNKQTKQIIIKQLHNIKVQILSYKMMYNLIKQQIIKEIQYLKSQINSYISQSMIKQISKIKSDYSYKIQQLQLQINNLKIKNKQLINKKQQIFKNITFNHQIQQKQNLLNLTLKLKQHQSPNINIISPREIINIQQWKTYKFTLDQNLKTQENYIKNKIILKQLYEVPIIKKIIVGVPPIKNGFAILKSGNHIIYKGMWKQGKFQGSGKLIWENYCYQGNFINGGFEGHGKLQIKDLLYVGKFKDNRASGEGTLQIGNKKIIGIWDNNKLLRIF